MPRPYLLAWCSSSMSSHIPWVIKGEAFGRINLLHKLLQVTLDIDWKLILMHTLVWGITSTTWAALLASSSTVGSRMSIFFAQLMPGIFSGELWVPEWMPLHDMTPSCTLPSPLHGWWVVESLALRQLASSHSTCKSHWIVSVSEDASTKWSRLLFDIFVKITSMWFQTTTKHVASWRI